MKRSKQYVAAAKLVDANKSYTLAEAVALMRQAKYAKFNETVEAHIRLGVDPRNADQQVRGTVELPHGTGKDVRVLVFAQGEHLKAAEEAGAEFVGGAELAQKVVDGWTDFEAVVATPDMMREVGKLGKVLGPRGLMPNPKTGTVTFDVAQAVKSLKAGRVEYRLDRNAIIHAALGKMSFTDEQIVENVASYLDAIIKARPSSVKGTYAKSISLSSSMGPGIKVAYEGKAV
jgi:large subunit ribosomal protein L1